MTSCGTCVSPDTCGGGGTANVCGASDAVLTEPWGPSSSGASGIVSTLTTSITGSLQAGDLVVLAVSVGHSNGAVTVPAISDDTGGAIVWNQTPKAQAALSGTYAGFNKALVYYGAVISTVTPTKTITATTNSDTSAGAISAFILRGANATNIGGILVLDSGNSTVAMHGNLAVQDAGSVVVGSYIYNSSQTPVLTASCSHVGSYFYNPTVAEGAGTFRCTPGVVGSIDIGINTSRTYSVLVAVEVLP